MELDDLKAEWQALNDRLDRQEAMNVHILKTEGLDKTRHGLRHLAWGGALGMVVGALLAVTSAMFWTNHLHTAHLLIAGMTMHVYGLAMIFFGARLQVLISRIDYAAPVVEIQRRLAELRRFYVGSGKWIGLPWFVLWLPSMQMVFMGLFGADLYLNAPLMVISNLVAGTLLWAFVLVLHRWSRRRPRLDTKIEQVMVGSTLNRAQKELEAIMKFEREG